MISKQLSFSSNSKSDKETRFEKSHLVLETSEHSLFLDTRDNILNVMHEFYFNNKYIEITSLTLVQTQVKGMCLSLLINYKQKTYTTQSFFILRN